MKLQFTVPGRPVPKERPRRVKAKNGQMVTYTPKATQQYEELVALHARAAVAQARWEHDGNVYVEVAISKGGVVVLVEPSDRDRFWHADVDNYAKSLMDGMEGIVYGNDRRVVDLAVYFEEKS